MSKRFSIHDWQAKQRKQLLNEGVWEIGSKQDIQEFINKLKQLKNVYYNIVGSDEVQNGLDAALKGAEELMRNAKPGMNENHNDDAWQKRQDRLTPGKNPDEFYGDDSIMGKLKKDPDYIKKLNAKNAKKEHHEEEAFPEVDQKTKDYLDKLEKTDPSAYKAVEDYIKAMGGINEMSTTGGGASFSAGSGEAYATPRAFKKKNKED
jgi:hypothetical protein